MASAPNTVELNDIQGLVRFAYGHHKEAEFLLLRIRDVVAARKWLSEVELTDSLTRTPVPSTAIQLGLTSEGLRSLGVAEGIIDAFAWEFVDGMAGDPSRSRRLGDLGLNDPSRWQWGSAATVPHVVVLLYALPGLLHDLQQSVETQIRAGFEIMQRLSTSDMGEVEPFGFVDGISQPELDWDRRRAARASTELAYTNLSCLGEFLLGYPNEYGLYTSRPLLEPGRDSRRLLPRAEDAPGSCDLGRNGTYLVIRQLRQDVYGFWQALNRYADGVAAAREQLASALVGRRLSGEPLVGEHDIPSSLADAGAARAAQNSFSYLLDPNGVRCPFGAHIRRSNPRNADLPPGRAGIVARLLRTLGLDAQARAQDLASSTRFHRLLRRGREYGSLVTPAQAVLGEPASQQDRGIQFACLGANIQRQFEFVQSAWLMNTKFTALDGESDPLIGNRLPLAGSMPTDGFSLPQADGPSERLRGLPQFVTVLGGAYFFMPGIRALRFLSGAR